MTPPISLAGQARWHVRWISKGRRIDKDYGTDFGEALRVFTLAVQADKKATTLICKNFGFPPPKELRPHMAAFKKRNARGRMVRVERPVEPMRELNHQGIWWCPYCIKKRRFVRRNSVNVSGVRVNEPAWYCPICDVSHRDFHVRTWNPLAQRLMANPDRRARKPGSRRTRRQARTGYTT